MDWTSEVIYRLHEIGSTCKELSEKAGYTAPYLSMLLNKKKKCSKKTKICIFNTLSLMEKEYNVKLHHSSFTRCKCD